MGAKTGIEWTDATWNPIRGCSRVSEGCRHCYAETMAYRFSGEGKPYAGLAVLRNGHASWTGKVEFVEEHLLDPLKWKPAKQGRFVERYSAIGERPRRIFVNSMSDLFHEGVTDEWIDLIFGVMAHCPQHIFQVLTKRPERMLAYVSVPERVERVYDALVDSDIADGNRAADSLICRGQDRILKDDPEHGRVFECHWPLPNVWLGVSVENQAAADERIPLLLKTPAAVRFISAEPLLGAIDFGQIVMPDGDHLDTLYNDGEDAGLDWVICGGESGPGARPMHPDWARSLRDQCAAAGVPFFFKQWGEWTPGENVDRTAGHITVASLGGSQWFYANENLANDEGHRDDEPDVYRVGKKAAGALLDGVQHKAFPAVRA